MHANNHTQDVSHPNPSVVVVGAGAIGGFYGGKLALGGARVSVVCRSDYDTVKANGIQVQSAWGDFLFKPEAVLRDAGEYGPAPDYVLVGLKVLPEIDTVKLIEAVVGPDTTILLIQNGVEIEEPVARAFPHNELLSGLAFICVSRLGPGRVLHQDYGRLVIGRYPCGTSHKAELLGELFNVAGVPCEVTRDVVTARWQKLVWNAPFNPISVLGGGLDTQDVLRCTESVNLVRAVMEEVCLVAEATGHSLPPQVVQKNIDDTRVMEAYKTSMLLDHEAKRPMEVEAILGNAVRAARREGVRVPHLESLYALLQLTDRRNRALHSCSS